MAKKRIRITENDITNMVREALNEMSYSYSSNPNFKNLFTGEYTRPGQKAYYVCRKEMVTTFLSDGFRRIGAMRASQTAVGNLNNTYVAGPGWYIMVDKPNPNLFPKFKYGDQYITVILNGEYPILDMKRTGRIALVPFENSDTIQPIGSHSMSDPTDDMRSRQSANANGNANAGESEWTSTATRSVSLEESIKRALSKAIKKVLNESKK